MPRGGVQDGVHPVQPLPFCTVHATSVVLRLVVVNGGELAWHVGRDILPESLRGGFAVCSGSDTFACCTAWVVLFFVSGSGGGGLGGASGRVDSAWAVVALVGRAVAEFVAQRALEGGVAGALAARRTLKLAEVLVSLAGAGEDRDGAVLVVAGRVLARGVGRGRSRVRGRERGRGRGRERGRVRRGGRGSIAISHGVVLPVCVVVVPAASPGKQTANWSTPTVGTEEKPTAVRIRGTLIVAFLSCVDTILVIDAQTFRAPIATASIVCLFAASSCGAERDWGLGQQQSQTLLRRLILFKVRH